MVDAGGKAVQGGFEPGVDGLGALFVGAVGVLAGEIRAANQRFHDRKNGGRGLVPEESREFSAKGVAEFRPDFIEISLVVKTLKRLFALGHAPFHPPQGAQLPEGDGDFGFQSARKILGGFHVPQVEIVKKAGQESGFHVVPGGGRAPAQHLKKGVGDPQIVGHVVVVRRGEPHPIIDRRHGCHQSSSGVDFGRRQAEPRQFPGNAAGQQAVHLTQGGESAAVESEGRAIPKVPRPGPGRRGGPGHELAEAGGRAAHERAEGRQHGTGPANHVHRVAVAQIHVAVVGPVNVVAGLHGLGGRDGNGSDAVLKDLLGAVDEFRGFARGVGQGDGVR